MKRRIRFLPLMLVSVLAFSAIAAAAAQAAPRWTVNGTPLASGNTEAFTGVNTTEEIKLATGITGLELTSEYCNVTGKIKGTAEEAPGENKEVKLHCTKVEAVGVPACIVKSVGATNNGEVTTNKLSSELVYLKTPRPATESEDIAGDLLKPESGEVFVEIEVTGCSIAPGRTLVVKGTALGKFVKPPVGTPAAMGRLSFPNTTYYTGEATRTAHTAGLTIGSNTATFNGTFGLALNSGNNIGIKRS
jgi:hypothetical protein